MTIRPTFLPPSVTIGWLLALALAGCGGQPGAPTDGGGATTDVTPPTIIGKYPADEQTNVSPDTRIAITFSEAIDVRRIRLVDAEITVSQAVSGTWVPVQKNTAWESASNTLFIRPTTLLDPNRHYTVRITNNIGDPTGNRLDLGNPDGVLVWRFTTGATFDKEKPVWRPNRRVQAFKDRYDTISVCWWNDDPPQTVTTCDAVEGFDAAAVDPPANDTNGLIYTVQYKRGVDAGFTNVSSGVGGAHRVTLSSLVADTDYEIRVQVTDMAANQADEAVAADPNPIKTPKAGRLYAANFLANSLSVISDAAQAQGDTAAAVVTTGQTEVVAPTGIAVDLGDPADPNDGYVYVADTSANMIVAYKLTNQVDVNDPTTTFKFGEYGIGNNLEPDWKIQGDLTATDITGLCGPSTLRVERHGTNTYLYVTNSLVLATGYSPGRCVPDNVVVFDVTQRPQSPNQPPHSVIRNANDLRTPLAFAVDEGQHLVYVANRDDSTSNDNAGGAIAVFSFTRNPGDPTYPAMRLGPAPFRSFWGSVGGACTVLDAAIKDRLCGPTAAVYDSVTDSLFVVNRGKNNLLVFSNVQSASEQEFPAVVEGPDTGLTGARPVGIFLDPAPFDPDPTDTTAPSARVYVTTDNGQSVLIFDRNELAAGGNVKPRRVIKGTKTLLGQPVGSHGPYAVAVVPNEPMGIDEAYVVTPGSYDTLGLTPIPTVAVFNVSSGEDPNVAPTASLAERITNTPPLRVVVNPLLGPTGMALDRQTQRLYVAGFHSNMILVYNDANDFASGLKAPDRIIAGPKTRLDHPVALLFRRDSFEDGVLYVVNQSSHSVAVFNEGDGTNVDLLVGDVAPVRYIGAPAGTNPLTDPFDATQNLTQMVFPTGLAVDSDNDIMYVSNRDATTFQDLNGRRIVAFTDASSIGLFDPTLGIGADNNIAPTWKIQGDPPPSGPCCPPVTDKTTLKRPAGLLLIPAAETPDGVDRLVVANRNNNTVLIFRGLSALVEAAALNPLTPPDDNVGPTWKIAHSAFFGPFGLAFDSITKDLYVSNVPDSNLATNSKILVFNLGSLAVGTPVPSLQPKVIQGSSTGLVAPHGLALDPQN